MPWACAQAQGIPSEARILGLTPQKPGNRLWLADGLAGLAMAGLLLPEAVAYAGIAGLPPAAGLMGLLAGLVVYGLLGRSRFAIVASTSSSAAVLGATTLAMAGPVMAHRALLAAGLVVLVGVGFALAALARLGSVSSFISKPVLRGFAFGLAVTIVVRQWAKVSGLHLDTHSTLSLAWQLLLALPAWNLTGLSLALAALLLLRGAARWRRVPGSLLVILLGIGLSTVVDLPARGVALVGPITMAWAWPGLPDLAQAEWLRLGEVALALVLLLFAESYGAIRSMALLHGDRVDANRDLLALGMANLASGLLQGMPVGAGYSATAANEAAGAQSRASGLVAAGLVLGLTLTVLPWIARLPEPVLAAIVISALAHALSWRVFVPYFRWRRDRVAVVSAVLAVLLLGVLDGLLVGITVSLAMTLRDLSAPPLSELGRRGSDGHDFMSLANYPDAQRLPGVLLLRPEAGLFFANVDGLLARVRQRLQAGGTRALVLSLEESPDLDGSAVEALQEFAAWMARHHITLLLARVKEPVAALLLMPGPGAMTSAQIETGSVDDAVQRLQALLHPKV